MKLFEDSPLKLLCYPLRLSPWHKDAYLRASFIYEHVFTPVVLAGLIHKLPFSKWIYLGVVVFHVIIKELIADRIKRGEFNWSNLVERTYGALLGALIIL